VTPSLAAVGSPAAVTAGVEIERQWRAHAGLRLPPAIGAWRLVAQRDLRLADHYYDTADSQLAEQRAQYAEEVDAALILLGSRGRSGIGSMLLGDVAHDVAQRSTRMVLLVPSPRLSGRRREELASGAHAE
jgi:hypothetical protein